jgi:hypothetical protein
MVWSHGKKLPSRQIRRRSVLEHLEHRVAGFGENAVDMAFLLLAFLAALVEV